MGDSWQEQARAAGAGSSASKLARLLLTTLLFTTLPFNVMRAEPAPGTTQPEAGDSCSGRWEQWARFKMGPWLLTDLGPAQVCLGAVELDDGVRYQQFSLAAATGRFIIEEPGGAAAPLSGRVLDLKIRGKYSERTVPNVDPEVVIEPGEMALVVRIEAGLLPGQGGGTLEFPRRRVWIENPDRIHIVPGGATGSLAFPSHPVEWRDAWLEVPELGVETTLELTSVDPDGRTGVEFRYDLERSALQVVSGRFRSAPLHLELPSQLALPGFTGLVEELPPLRAELTVEEETLTFSVDGVVARLDGVLAATPIIPLVVDGRLDARRVQGRAQREPDRVRVAELELIDATFAPSASSPGPSPRPLPASLSSRPLRPSHRPSGPSAVSGVSPRLAAASRAAAAAQEPCQPPRHRLSSTERSLLTSLGFPEPAEQALRAIAAAEKGLDGLTEVDLALHLPIEWVRQALALHLGTSSGLPSWVFDRMSLDHQQVVQCFDPSLVFGELGRLLPVELFVHHALAVEGEELVDRPSVRIAWAGPFRLSAPTSLADLLERWVQSVAGSAARLEPELRFPLPLRWSDDLRLPAPSDSELTIEAGDPRLDLELATAVLLIDPDGLHVLGDVR